MTATNRQKAGTKEDGSRVIEGHERGRPIGWIISPERLAQAEKLRKAGFVHVTGLPVCPSPTSIREDEKVSYIQARYCDLGHWDSNNGRIVVVTKDGEVWLAAVTGNTTRNVFGKAGAFVSCSNGESIYTYLLLERIADSYSDCGGQYPPIPDPRERN